MSIHHRLAEKDVLELQNLYGENIMLMHRGWSNYVDMLRDDLWEHHPKIHIADFDFYNIDVFNRCEAKKDVLLVIKNTDNKAPVELLGMRVIDQLIQGEVAYYKDIYEKKGLEGC